MLKEEYGLSKCCNPIPGNPIVGYHSYDELIRVHRSDCRNLEKVESDRLVQLQWNDILKPERARPDAAYERLDKVDFAILDHHRRLGIDYSLMVAKMLKISKPEAFKRHMGLKELGLIERVPSVMVRYRKTEVDNKWIKHRNHTYYRLTDKGTAWLGYYVSHQP